jgi:iron-sulfur cluster repair protein YtfE (RIC family)
MSDALDVRPAPPEAHRWLLDTFPRLRWHDPALGEVARFWLQMHAGFRHKQADMQGQLALWRNGGDLVTLHRTLIPSLQGFLQHLEGHHRVESGHYFPVMRRVEPRITAGIDLLDADHDAIHGHLETLFRSGLAFHQSMAGGAPDRADAAARLADTLDRIAPPLGRHLDDEEDIVIPLITRHADAFAH